MHWRDVCTGLAEMLSPADGLVGDLLIVSSLTALMGQTLLFLHALPSCC